MKIFAEPDVLIARAIQTAGASDFGASGWREGLEILLADMEAQPLSDAGRQRVEQRITSTLAARLKVEEWIAGNPAFGGGPSKPPIVIMGLPRTATTALLALLANDPQWRYLRAWEANEPVPPPNSATEPADPRRMRESELIKASEIALSQHIHHEGGPVDDAALLRLDFRNQEFGWPALDYIRWWRDCDMRTAYRYHARMLGLLERERPPHQWLVKAPWHNFHLDDLVSVYPEARFIMCHREPVKLLPSVASLVRSSYRTVMPDDKIDPHAIGRFVLEHLSLSVRRVMAFRDKWPDKFVDLYHRDFNAEPLANVERIYAWLGTDPGEETRAVMTKWLAENRRGNHGDHSYSAEEFGLSETAIRDAFAPYIKEFGV